LRLETAFARLLSMHQPAEPQGSAVEGRQRFGADPLH